LLYLLTDAFQQTAFWVWVLVFYLTTLALESVLLARGAFAGGAAGRGQQGSLIPVARAGECGRDDGGEPV